MNDINNNKNRKPTLRRETFKTSRLLDFASEKELTAQIGYARPSWPHYALKELVDNAIDACEDHDIAPVISVAVDKDTLTVEDNGPGIPDDTIIGVLDFAVRVSSREAYVSPTRGAQGNALKTILAIPFVESGCDKGTIEIATGDKLHTLTMSVDRIRQQPVIGHSIKKAKRRVGTSVRMTWPKLAGSLVTARRTKFLQISEGFAWLNPHLDLSVKLGKERRYRPTDTSWQHWKGNEPTSPHWYDAERFERLVSAYAAQDLDSGQRRTVRELIVTFRGLQGTAKGKAILDATGLARASILSVAEDPKRLKALHEALKDQSRPVKPELLGYIGEQHFRAVAQSLGCYMPSFAYSRDHDDTDNVPSLIEFAFVKNPKLDPYAPMELRLAGGEEYDEDKWQGTALRRLVTGVNWSPGLRNTFREVGEVGQSLDDMLGDALVSERDPVYFVAHLAHPRPQYMDRGKSGVSLS